jgi:uncharacterized protein YoxC
MVISIIAVAIVGFGIYWIRSHKDEVQSIVDELQNDAKDVEYDVESTEKAAPVAAEDVVPDVAPVADAPVAEDEVQK